MASESKFGITGVRQLHPGVKWVFRVNSYFSALFISIFISFFLFGVSSVLRFPLYAFAPVVLIVFIVLVEVFVRWSYNNWKYEFVKEGLKIERGIIWKTYKSIPYERIQNVDIRRGIIARLLGFSTLDIQTAGYSGFGSGGRGVAMSEGHLPGVSIDDAEKIRGMIMKKIGRKSGL